MSDKLQKYNSKRNFAITSEPQGKPGRSNRKKLKFSVQHHIARADHYDLRLELNGVALSWAIPKGPSFRTADKRLAMRVEDHPVDYMDFEGTIPKGEYGGGTVMLWDEGIWIPRFDPDKGLKDGSLKFRLEGERLKGDWALVKIKNKDGGSSEPWLLIKENDEYAKNAAGISHFSRGVRSAKTMAEISESAKANPFRSAEVMLAKPVVELPAGGEWIYELKYDGHRVLAFSQNGVTTLFSRNGLKCPSAFSPAAEAVSEILRGRAAVLDGEMVVAGKNGVPDFGALQRFIKSGGDGLNYVVFDLLALDGEDLRKLPLSERKKKLKALIKGAPAIISYSEHTDKMGKARIQTLKAQGMEGIVAKLKNSEYSAGKNGDWQKFKFRNDREFVIGGYCLSESGNLRSILVGFYKDGKLDFAGCVGTGFNALSKRELLQKFSKIPRKTSPFSQIPKEYTRGAEWVKPVYAAQVHYAEVTSSGVLRQASFKGLRTDKPAAGITDEKPIPKPGKRDTAEVLEVTISSPQKVMFPNPQITKKELAAYYAAVAERALPYLKDRFLSLVCCPSGIGGEQFFRRHFDVEFAGIKRAPAKDGEYFYITDTKSLIFLSQYNAIEFHVWGSKKSTPYRPDIMVFDLDPDEGLPLKDVRRGVKDLKEVLEGLGLKSFLKTSGGKGYHIVVPFKTGADGQLFRDFAKNVAGLLESKFPNRYTSSISKKERTGKIFIDWQRNSPGATWVAPYSVRARSGAAVSMPIAWEELSKIPPAGINVRTALKRLGADPWADFFTVKSAQRLTLKK